MIAALYVQTNGHYFGLPNVDPWDEPRDARKYAGPHPVVAHPPCTRWCQLAYIVEKRYGYKVGDDGGCFESALAAVRRWGGASSSIPLLAMRGPGSGFPALPARDGSEPYAAAGSVRYPSALMAIGRAN